MTTKEPVTKNGDKSASKSTINGDKRAEALERARALRARYDSATTVHPSTYAQLADAHELLALHAENEKLTLAAQNNIEKINQLTAENNALLQRIEKFEAVADKARAAERVYWDFEKSMKSEVVQLKKALEALDGENKS